MTDAIQHLVTRLAAQQLSDRIDTMMNAAIETGGYYEQPRAADNWSSHMVEIKAHNLSADGSTDAEAIRNWIRVAENHLDAERAAATITATHQVPTDTLRRACKTVIHHRGTAPHPLHARAELLLGVLERVRT
jgi:hypothetical protein